MREQIQIPPGEMERFFQARRPGQTAAALAAEAWVGEHPADRVVGSRSRPSGFFLEVIRGAEETQ